MESIELYEEFNDYSFVYENSVEKSKAIISDINIINKRQITFENDHWQLYLVLRKRFTHLEFHKIKQFCDKHNKNIFDTEGQLIIFKCWCASLLEKFEPLTVKNYIDCFKGFVEATEGLKYLSYEKVLPNTLNLAKNVKNHMSVVILNLLDFYPEFFGDNNENIYLLLENLKLIVDKKNAIKKIPSTYDFLVLDRVINDYFSRELTKPELIKWGSIKFWWNITTIIPLRISEFCLLKKKSLVENSDGTYLEITRVKLSSRNKDRIVDLIKIPKSYYDDLKDYIQIQNEFDSTSETVFSRKAVREYIYEHHKTLLFPDFNAHFFRNVLTLFYREIVCEIYGYYDYVNKAKQVFPNDTRHLAFINLKLQGYTPVEVARIGGHVNISTQEHYFSHVSNMMDLELLSIFSRYRIETYNYISKEFINEHVLKPTLNIHKMELELGYCTDPEMNCRVEDCIDCEAWRITPEELHLKKDIILSKMNNVDEKLNNSIKAISKLYEDLVKISDQSEKLKDYVTAKERLNNNSNEIFRQLDKYLNLISIQRRLTNNEKTI